MKIQAFVQDSLDAHEKFLQGQATQTQKTESEHVEADQTSEGLEREQLEKDYQYKSNMNQPLREEEEQQEQDGAAEIVLETEKADDHKQQQNQSHVIQQTNMGENGEKKQPPLVRAAPPEAEEVAPAHGPGPLVTELQDEEQLETILLPVHLLTTHRGPARSGGRGRCRLHCNVLLTAAVQTHDRGHIRRQR